MKKFRRLIALVATVAMAVSTFVPVMTASAATETATETLLDLQFNSADDAAKYNYVDAANPTQPPVETSTSSANIREGFLDIYMENANNAVYFPLSKAMNIDGEDDYTIKMRVKMPADSASFAWRRFMALVDSSRIGSAGTGAGTGVWHRYNESFLTLYRNAGNSFYTESDKTLPYGSDWNDVTIEFADGNVTTTVSYEGESGTVTNTATTALSTLTTGAGEKHTAGRTYDQILMTHYDAPWTRIMVDYITVERTYEYDPYTLLDVDFEDAKTLPEDIVSNGSNVLTYWGKSTVAGPGWDVSNPNLAFDGQIVFRVLNGWTSYLGYPLTSTMKKDSGRVYTVSYDVAFPWNYDNTYTWASRYLYLGDSNDSSGAWGDNETDLALLRHGGYADSANTKMYPQVLGQTMSDFVMEPGVLYHATLVLDTDKNTFEASFSDDAGQEASLTGTIPTGDYGWNDGVELDKFKIMTSSNVLLDNLSVTMAKDSEEPGEPEVPEGEDINLPKTDGTYLAKLEFSNESDADLFTYRSCTGVATPNVEKQSYYSISDGNLLYFRGSDDNFIQIPFSEDMNLEGSDVYQIQMRAKLPKETYRFLGLVNLEKDATYTTSTWQKLTSNYLTMFNNGVGFELKDDMGPVAHGGSDVWSDIVLTYKNGTVKLEVSYEQDGETVTNVQTVALADVTGSSSHNHRAGTLYDALMLANISGKTYTAMYFDYIAVVKNPTLPTETYTVKFVDHDGTVISEQTVTEGYNAVAPADPTRAGYLFTGWDKAYTNVQSNLTVTAQYKQIIAGKAEVIADYTFDDINNKTGIEGLRDARSWLSSAGYLSMAKTEFEEPVYLALDEDICLDNDFIYTIETMIKVPLANYRYMSLSNKLPGEHIYQAMMNHFMIGELQGDSTSKGIRLAQITEPTGYATGDEWRKVTYTFTKDLYVMDVIVYNEDGSVKSDDSITGPISQLMGTTRGNGKILAGDSWSKISFGNLYGGGTMLVDYVKATRLVPSETTPILESLVPVDAAGNEMTHASPRTAGVKATFSQPMAISSFTADSFAVIDENGQTITGAGSLSADKKVYTYTFDGALTIGQELTAKISKAVMSENEENIPYGNRLSYTVVNPVKLLDVDYDTTTAPYKAFSGSAVTSEGVEDNGNKFLTVKGGWTYSGYLFTRPIAYNDTNTYRFAFDFNMEEETYTSKNDMYVSLYESTYPYTSTDYNNYNNLNLLGWNSAGQFVIANSVVIPGDTVEFGEWYSYELLLKRDSGEYQVKITKRGDKTVVAGGTGLLLNAPYGGLVPRNYDAFAFMRDGKWSVDNIFVEQVVESPVAITALTSKVGNIYGTGDAITFDVTINNDTDSIVDTQSTYTVTDYDGRIIETGTLYNGGISPVGSVGRQITVANASKYGVYEIHFDADTYVSDTDEEFEYTSYKYMFSRINNKDADAPTNKFLAVNQTLGVSNPAFAKMMADAGIGGVRSTFNWHHFESYDDNAGEYKKNYQYDLAEDLKDNGIDVMAIFTDLNPHYVSSDWVDGVNYKDIWEINVEDIYKEVMAGKLTMDDFNQAYEAWLNHVEWLVENYADQVDYWEVFNESYSRMYNGPKGSEDATYATAAVHYLETYAKPIKEIVDRLDPTAEVVGICTDGVMFEFVSQCIKHMGNNWPDYVDSISVHPYDWCFDNQNYKSGLAGTFGNWSVIIRDYQYEYLVEQIKDVWMKEYITDGSEIPVHYTEIGLASTKGYASLKMQAAELVQINAMTQTRDYADTIWWYNFENRDIRGDAWSTDIFNSADPRNGNYGWVGHNLDTVPYAAKPIYVAAAAYNKFLTNATPNGFKTQAAAGELLRVPTANSYKGRDDAMTRIAGFTATNGDDILVIWNDELTNDISITGWGELKVYDMFGNLIGTHNGGADAQYPLSLTASFEPVYVVGAFGDRPCDRVSFSSDITVRNAREEAVVGHEYTITITDAQARDLDVVVDASPYVQIVENNGFVDGVATIKVIPTADAEEEEQIAIKLMNGSEMVHYVNGFVDVVKTTFGRIKVGDTKISSVNGYDVLKTANQVFVELHADNFLRFNGEIYANVMVAYYDEDGALINATETVADQDDEGCIWMAGLSTVIVPVSVPENCARIKIMLWDGSGLMMPYDIALDYAN